MNFKRLFSAMFAIAWATACTTTSSAASAASAASTTATVGASPVHRTLRSRILR